MADFVFDRDRQKRIGFPEAIYCASKSVPQILHIVRSTDQRPLLFTKLDETRFNEIRADIDEPLDYHALSKTLILGETEKSGPCRIAIVAAGTSDLAIALEAERTLLSVGEQAVVMADVGVAGLWRLQERLDEIASYPIVIAIAGMDAALPTVLGGLIGSAIIAVPTSVGYGAARHGETALMAILSSCSSGLATTNIDNGYGAAIAALRVLRSADMIKGSSVSA